MRSKLTIFLTATVLATLALATSVRAQMVLDSVELAAGGRTIAGPGAQTLAVDDSVFVLGHAFPDVCVTVANIGARGKVGIRSVEEDASQFVRFTVEPGETGTSCYLTSQVSAISFVCRDFDPRGDRIQPVDPVPCKFLWRADKS
jgi:hypothetical protein